MRTFIFLVCTSVFSLTPDNIFSQDAQITIEADKDVTVDEVFEIIKNQTDYIFIYPSDLFKDFSKVNLKKGTIKTDALLKKALSAGNFEFNLTNENTIIVSKSSTDRQHKTITGKVIDSRGEPVFGANVYIKGGSSGVVTGYNGEYKITVPLVGEILVFSFIGMVTQEVPIEDLFVINVTLQDDVEKLEEVVINGYFSVNSNSFTGAYLKADTEDIETINPRNIFQVLEVLDPSFKIIENTIDGSNPNILPQIRVRGSASLPNLDEEFDRDVNLPIFIVNGFETSAREVFDLPPYRIASMTVLKDASATAIYGSNAANGVVVIELKKPKSGKLNVSYNVNTVITSPDLSDYNLLTAQEKLDFELIRGYEDRLNDSYNSKARAIAEGVETYWLKRPLETGLNLNHNLSIGGGSEDFTYGLNLNANPSKGVMKGSSRDRNAVSLTFNYRVDKFQFSNNMSYSEAIGNNSPYGSFSDYTSLNPYYRPYIDGKPVRDLNVEGEDRFAFVANPLWNGELKNVTDRNKAFIFTNNFATTWRPIDNLTLNARIAYTKNSTYNKQFLPALHTSFTSQPLLESGSYTSNTIESTGVSTQLGAGYILNIGKSDINANVVIQYQENKSNSEGFNAIGFPSENLSHPSFSTSYGPGGPTGTSELLRSGGLAFALNYIYDSVFFADFSYRSDISSQFGANNRWAGFWSAGLGVNLYNLKSIKDLGFVDNLRVRSSFGDTGSRAFNAYQALQVYNYGTEEFYNGYGIGVSLRGIGNPDLKWQKSFKRNIGVDAAFFNNKLSFTADYYYDTTSDAIVALSLPTYSGFNSYFTNIGGVINKGFDFSLNYSPIKTKNLYTSFRLTGSISDEEIIDIGDTYVNYNQNIINSLSTSPKQLINEGISTNTRYVAHSLGIDPATGQELFQDENGENTFEYEDAALLRYDNAPDIQGAMGLNVRYKQWTLGSAFQYGIGGKQFNSTLLNRVENIGLGQNNVDARVFEERWQQPGDISFYKDIRDTQTTFASSRFLQDATFLKFSSLSLSYEMPKDLAYKLIRMQSVRVTANTNDLFYVSSIKQERGLDFPFARTFNFGLSMNF